MYQKIDLSQDWRLFHCDLDHGLLGHSGRAYQRAYVPEDAVISFEKAKLIVKRNRLIDELTELSRKIQQIRWQF